jgi:hypothetical protein
MPSQQTAFSNNPTPYDFFMAPPAAPKRGLNLLLGGQSFRKRLLVVIGVVVVSCLVIALVSSLLGGSTYVTQFEVVAQDQNELIRVATEAASQTSLQTTLNLAETVQLSLTSAQQQLLTYLQVNGHALSTTQLSAPKALKTDQALTAAEAASNFDPVFAGIMQTGLQSYAQDIKTAYAVAGPKGKLLLQKDYSGAQLLLTQSSALAGSSQSQ